MFFRSVFWLQWFVTNFSCDITETFSDGIIWNHKVLLWPHAAFRTFHLSKLLYRRHWRHRAIVYLSHTQAHHTRHLYSCRWFNNFIFPPSISLSFPSPPSRWEDRAERDEEYLVKHTADAALQESRGREWLIFLCTICGVLCHLSMKACRSDQSLFRSC